MQEDNANPIGPANLLAKLCLVIMLGFATIIGVTGLVMLLFLS